MMREKKDQDKNLQGVYRVHSQMSCGNPVTTRLQDFETLFRCVPKLNVEPFLSSHTHMSIVPIPKHIDQQINSHNAIKWLYIFFVSIQSL